MARIAQAGTSRKGPGRRRTSQPRLLTKDAVRLALDGGAVGVACEGCPPLRDPMKRCEAADGRYYVCPICFDAKGLDKTKRITGAEVQGTIPMWQWIGEEDARAQAKGAPISNAGRWRQNDARLGSHDPRQMSAFQMA